MKKSGKKLRKIWCAIAIVEVAILFMPEFTAATDNGDVDVQAWFTWMQDNGKWHDWVECTNWSNVKDVLGGDALTLKIGQPVKCKFNIVPHIYCAVDFFIMETGVTNAYNVSEGNKQEQTVSYSPVYPGTEIYYNWTLTPNGNWTGTGPINLYWQVTDSNANEVSGYIVFANPMIINEQWTGPTYDNGNGGGGGGGGDGGIPGFEGIFVLAALLFIAMQKRKKK